MHQKYANVYYGRKAHSFIHDIADRYIIALFVKF